MERIYTYAKFRITPGHEQEFQELATRCFDTVKAKEPGTLFYEWFLNADGSECVAIDCYVDMDAMLAHIENNRDSMRRIIEIAPRDLEIFGANPMARIGGGKSTAGDDAFYGERFLGKL